ncbi:MAG: hypothetical protein IJ802_05165 [Kiritimatiellae bacterium]|nr:hypothetical protein [Kiritimatiellia bacterium]
MLAIFTAMHPLVDACSAGVLACGGVTWQRVLVYGVVAFAMQLPLGMFLDAFPRFVRGGFFLGTILAAASAVAAFAGCSGTLPLVAACSGNALFHLTAGKTILEKRSGASGPIGLFISTGALGLAAGRLWPALLPAFASALVACMVLAAWRIVWDGAAAQSANTLVSASALACFVFLFALVAWRSWAGLFAAGRTIHSGAAMLAAATAATLAGKAAGGYIARFAGLWRTTAASVAGSAALAFLCPGDCALAWLALLFTAQLATGPVLSLMFANSPNAGGTAFGANCLGLFIGSLP